MKKPERPLTVHGLHAKRAELRLFLKGLDRERHKTLRSLAQLDAVLDMFVRPNIFWSRYRPHPPIGSQTEFRNYVRDRLKRATRPVCIGEVARDWMRHYGIRGTKNSRASARDRVRGYFRLLEKHGLIAVVGMDDMAELYQIVSAHNDE